MTTARKGLATLVVVGVTGALAAFGTFSAFSDSTTNSGNSFSAGTVTLTNNDAGAAMFSAVTGGAPGAASTDRCIKVAYTGSISNATVKLYTTDATGGALAPYVDVTITPGTYSGTEPAFPSCTNFSASGSAIYTGTLDSFRTTKNSYANGVTAVAAAGTVYKFSYSIPSSAPNTAQGASTGSHSYTWEARNN
jgi:predicted ribosomally synthesized peptide with SipW-like signal peptide